MGDLKGRASVDRVPTGIEGPLHLLRHSPDHPQDHGVAVVDQQGKGVLADDQIPHGAVPFVLKEAVTSISSARRSRAARYGRQMEPPSGVGRLIG